MSSFDMSSMPDLRPHTSSSSQSFSAADDLAALPDMLATPPTTTDLSPGQHPMMSFPLQPVSTGRPSRPKNESFGNAYTPTSVDSNTYPHQSFPLYGSFSTSSFSSASGSVGGSWSSSADALPAISRDFAPPCSSETREPATAGGAPQSAQYSAFERVDNEDKPEATDGNAESMFSDPFGGSPKDDRQVPSHDGVDWSFIPQYRRASDGQFGVQPPPRTGSDPHASVPSIVTHVSVIQQMQHPDILQGHTSLSNRPQTSAGLLACSGLGSNGSFSSARTIVNQIEPREFCNSSGLAPPAQIRSFDDGTMPTSSLIPFRDAPMTEATTSRFSLDAGNPSVRPFYVPAQAEELTFVPLGGPGPKKRPRRTYNEIERLYQCGWNGCEKAYGTLNHLNAHVVMQRHGEKSLRADFKQMDKAWRKKKREAGAAEANAHDMNHPAAGWDRACLASLSSERDYDRRDSTSLMAASSSKYRGTSSSVAVSVDGCAYSLPHAAAVARYGATRVALRGWAPQHIVMTQQLPQQGFRINEGEHPAATPQNPFPGQPWQLSFPFQALTQPIPLPDGVQEGYDGQFASQQ